MLRAAIGLGIPFTAVVLLMFSSFSPTSACLAAMSVLNNGQ
jgi:hypothetical protein